MIVFNTIKKAEHYVKFCNKNRDTYQDGYDWFESTTSIQGQFVVRIDRGDSCGCGCDTGRYVYRSVLGRIKDKRTQALSIVLKKDI